ncbi:MAG: hypothetical protein D6800_00095 [Candidatus Zixiibacteriota bacterium]|nr:MAG: hypothetical protein D6800_00095 [candidate division Zixibacteria bacterium]
MEMETVADAIENIEAPHLREEMKRRNKLRILHLLPPDMQAPIVSYFQRNRRDGQPTTTLMYHPSHPDYYPARIVRELESAGFTAAPTFLAKWDDYRPSPFVGDPQTARYWSFGSECNLADWWPIIPVWCELNSYTGPEIQLHMLDPEGQPLKVSLGCSKSYTIHEYGWAVPAWVTARRIEYVGGWKYDPKSARLVVPDHWEMITNTDGDPVAQKSAQSYAYAGFSHSPQSAEGEIYWTPIVDDLNMKQSEIIDYLTAKRDAQAANR